MRKKDETPRQQDVDLDVLFSARAIYAQKRRALGGGYWSAGR